MKVNRLTDKHMKSVFLLFAIIFCGIGSLLAQVNTEKKDVLLNSMQLENEPTYTNLDSALANPEMVYKLSLEGQTLKTLPPEFGTLVNLQILNLSHCKLKELPLEIKDCQKLQMISLYHNKLRYLPAEMHELKNLEILYLGNNKLFEMPRWFSNLRQLRRLDISHNRMTPAEVSAAKRMLPKAEVTY
jgi:leucine-rich repeat protein SHOC2